MKLYADEPGADAVRRLDVIVVSCLARVEVPAAIWRKHRTARLAAAQAATLVAEFEADWFGGDGDPPRFVAADLASPLLDLAARLCGVHGLRAYDGIQLATARAVRDLDTGCDTFACADASLRRAAAAEGFRVIP